MEEVMTEASEPLGNSRAWEAGGLGVAKQNTVKGIPGGEGERSWVFSLPPPQVEGSPAQEAPDESGRRGAGPLHRDLDSC